jgi:hypothetical protein
MIDILGLFIEKAVSWGIDKVFEVVVECDHCGEEWDQRIENSNTNHFGCKNCNKQVVQFTNACNTTVSRNGEIGHTASKVSRNYTVGVDPLDKSWFSKAQYPSLVFFPLIVRAKSLSDTDIVLFGNISDYDTKQVFDSYQQILTSNYYDCSWNELRTFYNWEKVPESKRQKGKIFAVDTVMKSRYGEVLHSDRIIINLFG